MTLLLIILHVLACIALIMIVLLQTGKGADMGAAFGGGSSQTLFGSTGATTFLSKATIVAAVVFMVTSLGIGFLSRSRTQQSIMPDTRAPIEQPQTLPAGTGAPAPVEKSPSVGGAPAEGKTQQ